MNARTLRSFEKNVCPTLLYRGLTNAFRYNGEFSPNFTNVGEFSSIYQNALVSPLYPFLSVWVKLDFLLEINPDSLYESTMISDYILEFMSYEGFQISFSLSQKYMLTEAVNAIDRASTIIQSQEVSTEISIFAQNITVLENSQVQFNNIDTILASILNSTTTTNSTEANRLISLLTNYTSTLQSLGKTRETLI